jgi:hypothetical protein
MNQKQGVKRSFLYRIIVPVLIIILLIYFVSTDFGLELIFGKNESTIYPGRKKWMGQPPGSGWVLFFTWLLFLYPIYWFSKWLSRCPKCYKWDAANKIKTDILGIDSDRDRYFSETTSQEDLYGNLVKTTRNYKEESWTTHYLDHFECEFCEHKWENKRSKNHSVKNEI